MSKYEYMKFLTTTNKDEIDEIMCNLIYTKHLTKKRYVHLPTRNYLTKFYMKR